MLEGTHLRNQNYNRFDLFTSCIQTLRSDSHAIYQQTIYL